jgi:hypothetical protein
VTSFCLVCGFVTDLLVSVFGDRRVVTSFCLVCEFKPYLLSMVFADRRVVTSFCLDSGFVTDLFVTLFVDRRLLMLSTGCLSLIGLDSDRLAVLLPEDSLTALLF